MSAITSRAVSAISMNESMCLFGADFFFLVSRILGLGFKGLTCEMPNADRKMPLIANAAQSAAKVEPQYRQREWTKFTASERGKDGEVL
jgi:hypothetical protein